MAFTVADAKALAETWASVSIDTNQALVWGNEFLRRKVAKRAWPETTVDFATSVAGTWYSLPVDFESLILLTDKADTDIEYDFRAYMIRNRKIKFAADGDYTMTYRQMPTALASINTAPALPDEFLYAMAEYLLFRFFNIYVDDDGFKKAAIEYEARCNGSLKDIYGNMDLDTDAESFRMDLRW